MFSSSTTNHHDRELERRIHSFLAGRNYPALRNLRVRVEGGHVIVSGRVFSYHEKQIASSCAQRVPGVLEVINQVEVAAQPHA